mgnify:CR=1 FL=1
MPELPDIVVYVESLEARVLGETLDKVRLSSPFLLRTVSPPLSAAEGRKVSAVTEEGSVCCLGSVTRQWKDQPSWTR